MYFLSWAIFSKSCTEHDSYIAVPYVQFQNDCTNENNVDERDYARFKNLRGVSGM